MYPRCMESNAPASLAVIHPEGYVHTFDFFQMVGFREGRWQQDLFTIVLFQSLYGIFLVEFEWQNIIWL